MILNSILKIGVISLSWVWLKPRWKPLFLCVIYMLFVILLHSEYIEYVRISEERGHLALSYVLKWGLLLVGFLGYLFFYELKSNEVYEVHGNQEDKHADAEKDDAFASIRAKSKLSSRADKIIGRK